MQESHEDVGDTLDWSRLAPKDSETHANLHFGTREEDELLRGFFCFVQKHCEPTDTTRHIIFMN